MHEVLQIIDKVMKLINNLCNLNSSCCKNNYNYKVCLVNSCNNVKNYLGNDYFKDNYSKIN